MSFTIRAGELDKTVTIMRETPTIGQGRAKASAWAPYLTLRAKSVEASFMDALRAGGAFAEGSRTFLVRWADGITTADRVSYAGDLYSIQGVSEMGRRVAMSIRCQALKGSVTQ